MTSASMTGLRGQRDDLSLIELTHQTYRPPPANLATLSSIIDTSLVLVETGGFTPTSAIV